MQRGPQSDHHQAAEAANLCPGLPRQPGWPLLVPQMIFIMEQASDTLLEESWQF